MEFQSTPPRGGRPSECARLSWCCMVSIHAPAWGATRVTVGHAVIIANSCFNPRPRVGGDSADGHVLGIPERMTVSIHAPAWGATSWGSSRDRSSAASVSIHAPAWGATTSPVSKPVARAVHVSIHAPAWGATDVRSIGRDGKASQSFQSTPPRGGRPDRLRLQGLMRATWSRFNPRPRVGGDLHLSESRYGSWRMFQSTPPRGGRLLSDARLHRHGMKLCFNPRPRVGGDAVASSVQRVQELVSIHAPAWGATGVNVTHSGTTTN